MDFEYNATDLVGSKLLYSLVVEYETSQYEADYLQRRQCLRELFAGYRTATPELKKYLSRLVDCHTKNCRGIEALEIRRRHNTFVLRFIAERKYTHKEIARIQGVTLRQVYKDLNCVLDDLMVLAFGCDGVKPKKSKVPKWLPAGLEE